MSSILIKNIGQLVNIRTENHLLRGSELAQLPVLKNAFIIIEDDEIAAYGSMDELQSGSLFSETIDAANQFVLPCWCDSHTHLVFAASRENEFIDKIKGATYQEGAAKGGGILNAAIKLN